MAKRVVLNTAIRVDTAQFKRAMSQVKSDFASTGRAMKGIGIAAFATATTTASLSLAKAAKHFDRIGKLSKQFGSSTDFLQNIAKSSELAGVNLESVAKIQRKLITASREAEAGLSTYVRAFEDLGINSKEFIALNADEKFIAFSRAISMAGDDATKLGAAIAIGGRSVGDALPLLRDYKTVLADINKTAALDRQQIQNIEAFNDQLATLKQTAVDLAGPALSALNEFVQGTKTLFGGRSKQEQDVATGRGTRRKAMREREKEIDAAWEADRAQARERRRKIMAEKARRRKFGNRIGSGVGVGFGLGAAAGLFSAAATAVTAQQAGERPIFDRPGGGPENFAPGNVFKNFPNFAGGSGGAAAAPTVTAPRRTPRGIGSARALAGRQDLGVQGFNPMNSMSGAARRRHQERLAAMKGNENQDPTLQRLDKQVTALQSIDEKMTTSR